MARIARSPDMFIGREIKTAGRGVPAVLALHRRRRGRGTGSRCLWCWARKRLGTEFLKWGGQASNCRSADGAHASAMRRHVREAEIPVLFDLNRGAPEQPRHTCDPSFPGAIAEGQEVTRATRTRQKRGSKAETGWASRDGHGTGHPRGAARNTTPPGAGARPIPRR